MGSKTMYLKGASELASKMAIQLIEEGFNYEDIRNFVIQNTNYTGSDIERFEDKLFTKIEKYSQYIYVVNINTKEEFYYHTVRELSEDTGLTVGAINGSIYGTNYANSIFDIYKKEFTTKELCKSKKHLFSKKIGKVKIRQYHTKSGKYMSKPLKVTDTLTDSIMIYQTARLFCNEFDIKSYNLSKYILNNWKYKGRYKLERYKVM